MFSIEHLGLEKGLGSALRAGLVCQLFGREARTVEDEDRCYELPVL